MRRTSAREWLRVVLAEGPAPARAVYVLGQRHGYSRAALYKALRRLGGRSLRVPGKGRIWVLPKNLRGG